MWFAEACAPRLQIRCRYLCDGRRAVPNDRPMHVGPRQNVCAVERGEVDDRPRLVRFELGAGASC
jgi:hypothetical protein